jgi:hypothetical protein
VQPFAGIGFGLFGEAINLINNSETAKEEH